MFDPLPPHLAASILSSDGNNNPDVLHVWYICLVIQLLYTWTRVQSSNTLHLAMNCWVTSESCEIFTDMFCKYTPLWSSAQSRLVIFSPFSLQRSFMPFIYLASLVSAEVLSSSTQRLLLYWCFINTSMNTRGTLTNEATATTFHPPLWAED